MFGLENIEFEQIELLNKWVLWLLPFPFFLYFLLPKVRFKSSALRTSNLPMAEKVAKTKAKKAAETKRKNIISILVMSICWVLLILTMAQPVLKGKPEIKVKTSRNFLIVVDISHSMAEKDWKVNGKRTTRWNAVKSVMADFIDKRKGDRMGLIMFGSSAYVQAPFTPDLETVNKLLNESQVGMAGQMTHIGKAIVKGIELFDRDTLKTKVMLLLTDGVDAGTDILPVDAAQMAKQDSIQIYTIGIGDPNQRFSGLDEKALQTVSSITAAKYFRAMDTKNLEEIYDELNKLEPIEYEEESFVPHTELYHISLRISIYLLIASAGLMLLFRIIQRFLQK